MKKVEETIVIPKFFSEDGQEFSTEAECIRHERFKEYNDLKIDSKLLEEYKPENYRHFAKYFMEFVYPHIQIQDRYHARHFSSQRGDDTEFFFVDEPTSRSNMIRAILQTLLVFGQKPIFHNYTQHNGYDYMRPHIIVANLRDSQFQSKHLIKFLMIKNLIWEGLYDIVMKDENYSFYFEQSQEKENKTKSPKKKQSFISKDDFMLAIGNAMIKVCRTNKMKKEAYQIIKFDWFKYTLDVEHERKDDSYRTNDDVRRDYISACVLSTKDSVFRTLNADWLDFDLCADTPIRLFKETTTSYNFKKEYDGYVTLSHNYSKSNPQRVYITIEELVEDLMNCSWLTQLEKEERRDILLKHAGNTFKAANSKKEGNQDFQNKLSFYHSVVDHIIKMMTPFEDEIGKLKLNSMPSIELQYKSNKKNKNVLFFLASRGDMFKNILGDFVYMVDFNYTPGENKKWIDGYERVIFTKDYFAQENGSKLLAQEVVKYFTGGTPLDKQTIKKTIEIEETIEKLKKELTQLKNWK